MSVSQHPIALRVEQHVGGATRLLATVMALPLIDGIFPALVIAGALSTPFGLLETGLLIFGGSATMAVILAEMEGTHREQVLSILVIGAVLIPIAAIEAALAMTFDSVLNLEIFRRFAGLVILAIAAKTASSKLDEYLPGAGVIIALGLVASVEPGGAALQLSTDLGVVLRGAAAATVGVGFALSVALLSPHLRGRVDLDRFRFGSAVALGVLALPILGVLDTDAPIALAVLVVTALLAYDPDSTPAPTPGFAGGSDDAGPDAPTGAPGDGERMQPEPTSASTTASSLRFDGDATPADREIAARGAVAGSYPGVNRHSSGGGSPTHIANGGGVRSGDDRVRPDPDRVDDPVDDSADDPNPDSDRPASEDATATPGEDGSRAPWM